MTAPTPLLVCLLPVRNAAADLGDWLDEAARFADAVVALDDGSMDETGEILARHPLVARVISNRRRAGYLGWHDGVNRNRLLAAAGELSPTWLFFLDADERLDPTDADALRSFVAGGPVESCAYGFRIFRMLPGEHYDPAYQVGYRLFRFDPGHRVPPRRLHLMPVPRDIPALMETTLRIKHYGELGDEGRQARVDKLREADPEGSFLAWYNNLPPLSPGPHPQWTPRVSDGAVLTAVPEPGATDIDVEAEAAALDLEGPVLTVALLAARGEEPEGISKLAALPTEQLAVPVQRLLVTETPSVGDSTDRTEGVDVVAVPAGSRPAAMANAALAAARGDYLVFLTIPTAISAADLAAIVTAHDQGHALVAGTLVDPTATPAGHADALLDQPVMGDQQWRFCAAGYVSYAREPLRGVGGFDELTAAPEAAVVRRLVQRGATAVVVPELRIAPRPLASAGALIRHRFNVGRAMISDDGERWPPTASTDLWRIGAAAMRQAAVGSRSVSSVRRAGPASGVAVTGLVWAGAVATLVGAATEAVVRRRRGARNLS